MKSNFSYFSQQVKFFCEHLDTKNLRCKALSDRGARDFLVTPTSVLPQVTPSENIYFLPQISNGYKDSDITGLVTLFIDIDTPPIHREFTVEPNCTVTRSDGDAMQAFWFLDTPLTKNQFEFCITKLIKKYNGDVAVKNPARLMRLAGLTRGRKAKDAALGLPDNLIYKFDALRIKKLTLKDVALLIGCTVEQIAKAELKTESFSSMVNINLTQDDDGSYGYCSGDFDDYSVEIKKYFEQFGNRKKGSGSTQALFAFSCELEEKGKSLAGLRGYALEHHIDLDIKTPSGESLFDEVKDWQHNMKSAKNRVLAKSKDKLALFREKISNKYDETKIIEEKLINLYFCPAVDKFYQIEPDRYGEYPYAYQEYTRTAINEKYAEFFKYTYNDGKGNLKEKKDKPSAVLLHDSHKPIFPDIKGTCYLPHRGMLYKGHLNRWQRPKYSQRMGDYRPFVESVKHLLANHRTEDGQCLDELFLDYIAFTFCSQEPANFHWIIRTANHGVGKSLLTDWFFKPVFGSTNVLHISKEHLDDKFTSFDEKELVVVEELDGDLYKKLKPVMAQASVSVRKMRQEAKTVERTFSFICFTNEAIPIKLERNDRRILFVDSNAETLPPIHYTKLKKWKENPDNIAALAKFLTDRYKSMSTERKERMLGHAPYTSAKGMLSYNSVSARIQSISHTVEEFRFGDKKQFVRLEDMPRSLYRGSNFDGDHLRNAMHNDLVHAGFIPIPPKANEFTLVYSGQVVQSTIYIDVRYTAFYNLNIPKCTEIIRGLLKDRFDKSQGVSGKFFVNFNSAIQESKKEEPHVVGFKEDNLVRTPARALKSKAAKQENAKPENPTKPRRTLMNRISAKFKTIDADTPVVIDTPVIVEEAPVIVEEAPVAIKVTHVEGMPPLKIDTESDLAKKSIAMYQKQLAELEAKRKAKEAEEASTVVPQEPKAPEAPAPKVKAVRKPKEPKVPQEILPPEHPEFLAQFFRSNRWTNKKKGLGMPAFLEYYQKHEPELKRSCRSIARSLRDAQMDKVDTSPEAFKNSDIEDD